MDRKCFYLAFFLILKLCRYFFLHEGNRLQHSRGELIPCHELWKGMVVGIRKLPPDIHSEPLIQVLWFWSKSDIEAQFLNQETGIPDCMRRCGSRISNKSPPTKEN